MRIIFLDIDGVLNRVTEEPDLVPELIDKVNYIVRQTGAKIVISSTWRSVYKYVTLVSLLTANGLDPVILGVTPDTYRKHTRGIEILMYLEAHPEYFPCSFIGLDDAEDLFALGNRFMGCHSLEGVNDDTVEKAIPKLLAPGISYQQMLRIRELGDTLDATPDWESHVEVVNEINKVYAE